MFTNAKIAFLKLS